ncbi:hypothetical protein predicted by Glimmer/Critica [Limosilactobacillus fermentum]|nr:hypothetical protein predicted by Glimmer/Critica [Limosilactobacillus fermentum]
MIFDFNHDRTALLLAPIITHLPGQRQLTAVI